MVYSKDASIFCGYPLHFLKRVAYNPMIFLHRRSVFAFSALTLLLTTLPNAPLLAESTTPLSAAQDSPLTAPIPGGPPPSSAGRYLSSRFAERQGDIGNAEQYLEQVLRQKPDDREMRGRLLTLKLALGKTDEALEFARSLKNAPAREAIVDVLLAMEEVRVGHFDAAAGVLGSAFPSQKAALWLPLVMAWLDAGQSKIQRPLQLSDILPEGTHVLPVMYYHLGLLNDFAGYPDQARKQYEMAIEDRAHAPYRAVAALAEFYERQGLTAERDSLLAEYRQARPEAVQLLDDAPRRVAGTVADGISEVLFTMASVLYNAEASQDALLYLRLCLMLKPDFDIAHLLLGSALERQENYAEASMEYLAVKEDSALYEQARLRAALLVEKQGRADVALAQLDAMAAADEKSPEPFIAKGDLLRSKGRFAEAADAYGQALARVQPGKEHWPVYFMRGASYERTGQWALAEADFERALELDPEQPEVLNYLGYGWLSRGEREEEARQMIERAYAARPDEPHIIDSMAWAHFVSGEYEEAQALLERAIELMPNDPTINEHLGDVYWKIGRNTEARYQWQRALTFSPDPPAVESIKKKLAAGLPPEAMTTASGHEKEKVGRN